MNEILRDHEHVSVRLVLTPEQLVIDEARRTFTYLSLYGFLTDAVIANRILPPRSTATSARGVSARPSGSRRSSARSRPSRCSRAPFFAEEVCGAEMLDALGEELFAGVDPAAVLHDSITQELDRRGRARRAAARAAVRAEGRDRASPRSGWSS